MSNQMPETRRRHLSVSEEVESCVRPLSGIKGDSSSDGYKSEDASQTNGRIFSEGGSHETSQRPRDATISEIGKIGSVFIIILEHVISSITLILPTPLIDAFTSLSRFIFSFFKSSEVKYDNLISDKHISMKDKVLSKLDKLKNSQNFSQICHLNGFEAESHLVHTQDGFKLTLHRLKPENNGYTSNGKAIYFQHGLLMTSDVWCVMLNKDDNLPFRLCEQGYDVFLGNNRGNKYSNKHVGFSSDERKFWDFSIDEFAMYDIPSSIDYILKLKGISTLTYIGFSQGCSQILSSVSINDDLNHKIDKLVLIAPATTPKRLSNWLLNSIINFNPEMMYLLFGRKILMKSVIFWRKITYPPMFIQLIDLPNKILFDWNSVNIDVIQKMVSYYHLYSTTSVKCVVHWFQIIKSKRFQMYQEKDYFEPFEYPTDTRIDISKLLIIYGMNDSLVDIDTLVSQLPAFNKQHFTQIKDGKVVGRREVVIKENGEGVDDKELNVFGIYGHEHLDLLWGRRQQENVINNVLDFIWKDCTF